MTIEEISKAKAEAQEKILDIILHLEAQTNCKCSEIQINHTTEEGFGLEPRILIRYFKIIIQIP